MKSSSLRFAAVVAFLLVAAVPALAQDPAATVDPVAVASASNARTGPGFGIGLSVVGIGLGLGLIGFSALSAVARQPEQTGTIRGLMILLAALVEGAGIIGILFSLAMLFLA